MRLIDADVVIKEIQKQPWKEGKMLTLAIAWICMLIKNIPAIEIRRGKWTTNSNYPDKLICSVCGYKEDMWWADKGTNHCPNCGAKMEGKQDE